MNGWVAVESVFLFVAVLAVAFIIWGHRARYKKNQETIRALREELLNEKRIAKIVMEEADILQACKQIRRAGPESLKLSLMEISAYFPGRIKIAVYDGGREISTYSKTPPGWEEVETIEECCYEFPDGESNIRVVIQSDQPLTTGFDARLGVEVYSEELWVFQFAEAIFDNAKITRMARELETQNQVLETKVKVDPLTGLLNRRGFFDRLDEEIARALRSKEPLSLACFDLDFFKAINDTYGHGIGDLVLKQFAAVLKTEDRWPDVSARLGGDEFLLIFPETGEEGAMVALNRILRDLKDIDIPGHPEIEVKASVGLATLSSLERFRTKRVERSALLVELADEALLRAKQIDKGNIVVWEEAES